MVRLRFSAPLFATAALACWYIAAAGSHDPPRTSRLIEPTSSSRAVARFRVLYLPQAEALGPPPTFELDGRTLHFSIGPAPGSVTEYLGTQPGTHELSMLLDPEEPPARLETFRLDAASYTFVVSATDIRLVKDSVGVVEEGSAGAVLFNASDQSLWITGLGSALFETEQLRPGLSSPRWDLTSGRRLISVGTSPSNASFSFSLRSLAGSTSVVVFDRDEAVYVLGDSTVGSIRPLKKAAL